MKKTEIVNLIKGLERIRSQCEVKVTSVSIRKNSVRARVSLKLEEKIESKEKTYTKQEISNYKSYINQKKVEA